ncbi:MAG: PDZ domain-containing protein [Verrucomicrobia bacterium]|nr:PDZ domain-containing protein [Verrucomicrobiota bacterium]
MKRHLLIACLCAALSAPFASAGLRSAGPNLKKPHPVPRKEPAKPRTAWLGVAVRPADPTLRAQLTLPRGAGLVVEEVRPESPAAKAGIRVTDILLRLEDQWLFTPDQLAALVRSYKPGETVSLKLIRSGKPLELRARLESAPREAAESEPKWLPPPPWPEEPWWKNLEKRFPRLREWWERRFGDKDDWGWMNKLPEPWREGKPPLPFRIEPNPPARAWLGVVIADADPDVLARAGRNPDDGGAVIVEVQPGSPAAKAGLKPDDLVTAANGRAVHSAEELRALIGRQKPGSRVVLKVIRNGRPLRVEATLGKPPSEPSALRPFQKKKEREEWKEPEKHRSQPPALKKESLRAPRRAYTITVVNQEGTAIVTGRDGKARIEIRGPEGKELYSGPWPSEKARKALPESLARRLEKALRDLPKPERED